MIKILVSTAPKEKQNFSVKIIINFDEGVILGKKVGLH